LALVLRLDIDDANDIPIMPRLLHSINTGDYSLLQWFIQKRMIQGIGIPGQGINQQLATGASLERWATILAEAEDSPYGNVVNFPFSALHDHWLENELPFATDQGIQTEIPALFITGMLDCRTSVSQVEEIRQGFSQSVHVTVKGAGHEQAMWEEEAFDQFIPAFLQGQALEDAETLYTSITFIPLEGPSDRHPALRK
ncbi:MAG: alpha/beta hydrolase, partial [Bacteroidota bacterium]